jgi:glycosyltransferase involved in cell wall biosynthesis
MCFAVPSVATAVGGIPEVVEDGKTGILVPFHDAAPAPPPALARAIESLVKDPGLRKSMGAAAQLRARALFSGETIVSRYEALYRRVCR